MKPRLFLAASDTQSANVCVFKETGVVRVSRISRRLRDMAQMNIVVRVNEPDEHRLSDILEDQFYCRINYVNRSRLGVLFQMFIDADYKAPCYYMMDEDSATLLEIHGIASKRRPTPKYLRFFVWLETLLEPYAPLLMHNQTIRTLYFKRDY